MNPRRVTRISFRDTAPETELHIEYRLLWLGTSSVRQ